MTAFGIIADDLTGACDVGGAFAAVGRRVVVDLGRGAVPRLDDGDVVVVDAGVRDAAPADVRPAMKRAFARLAAAGAELRMLKIDSTLRGPVGGMLEAALDIGGIDTAVVAPAFPEQGRRLVNGRLEAHGVDAGVDLVAMLEGLGERVRLTTGRSLPAVLGAVRGKMKSGGGAVVIVDAEEVSDLEATARAWVERPARVLLVGSAGLAREVAEVWQRGRGSAQAPKFSVGLGAADPWFLIVAGSPAEATRRQLNVLAGEIDCDVRAISPSCGSSTALSTNHTKGASRTRNPGAKVLVVQTPPAAVRDRGEAAAALASVVSSLVSATSESPRGHPMGLVLVGGDTSARVLSALAVDGLEVRGEVEVGMPAVELRGGPWDGLTAITKAGGFGGERALVSAVDFLARKAGLALPTSSETMRAGSQRE